MSRSWLAATLLCLVSTPIQAVEPTYDLVVYGGTSAGVISAVQAKKLGKTVVIVCPDKHLGGLSASGLGWTDSGNKAVIGGLSREFYHRVWKHYQDPAVWKWQKRAEYGNQGQGTPAIDGEQRTMWIFEPHVAEKIFEEFVKEYEIPVHRDEWLDRGIEGGRGIEEGRGIEGARAEGKKTNAAGAATLPLGSQPSALGPSKGVTQSGGRITAITTLSGKTYHGRMFIDATYEGDLMAAAGVSYHVGREANAVYGEKWNGIQVGTLHHGHWFKKPTDPYVVPGKPESGLLPRISAEPPGIKGEGDHRVQAYCYRMCLTNADGNRIPFPKPEGYDAKQYELLLRVFANGWREGFEKFDPIPNHKTDTNNHGPFSTDNIGMNYDYPDGSYERRQEILAEHRQYQQGWLYFVANDPRVPEDVRLKLATWGLPKDEFTDNGGWPHQIYVREARRMIGSYVMIEQDCLDQRVTPDSVGMGSYVLDSHNVQRYVTPQGTVQNEGDIGVGAPRPYEIAYGSLVPKKDQCQNLLVPVCLSCSHIAFGSIRMEPVFMILGHSAATAACLSLDANIAVQDLPYATLREQLLKEGQVMELDIPAKKTTSELSRELEGIVVDDDQATLTGDWTRSAANGPFHANGYSHDGNSGTATIKTARFEAKLPPGKYEVRVAYPHNANRATNVSVTIEHAIGETKKFITQRVPGPIDGITVSLGTYDFKETGAVEITNKDADGYVIADAVQFVASQG